MEALNREVAEFLESCGFRTVSRAYVGEDLGNYGQGALTPEEIFDLGCRADHRDAEALVLSCTDIRAVEAIEALERHLRKPVVTSNQALMFCAAKRLGLALLGRAEDRLPLHRRRAGGGITLARAAGEREGGPSRQRWVAPTELMPVPTEN